MSQGENMRTIDDLHSFLRAGYSRARVHTDRLFERAGRLRVWEWGGLLLGAILLVSLIPLVFAIFAVALLVALMLAWVAEFVTLMRLPEAEFPAKHDKLIWTLLMIVVPPLGLLAFWTFRRSHWPDGVPVSPVSTTQKPTSPWSEDEWS
jgi:hypothetical protein